MLWWLAEASQGYATLMLSGTTELQIMTDGSIDPLFTRLCMLRNANQGNLDSLTASLTTRKPCVQPSTCVVPSNPACLLCHEKTCVIGGRSYTGYRLSDIVHARLPGGLTVSSQ